MATEETKMKKQDLKFNKNEDTMKLKLSALQRKIDKIHLGGGAKKIEKHHFEKVLIATGVEGNIENIGIENTKVRTKNNQIITHQYGMTDDNNIFAIGDVAGTPWLAHKASHEGIDCVEYISGLKIFGSSLPPPAIRINPKAINAMPITINL